MKHKGILSKSREISKNMMTFNTDNPQSCLVLKKYKNDLQKTRTENDSIGISKAQRSLDHKRPEV